MKTDLTELTKKGKFPTADWINNRTIQKPNENLNVAETVM
jgi:hypothetical protein